MESLIINYNFFKDFPLNKSIESKWALVSISPREFLSVCAIAKVPGTPWMMSWKASQGQMRLCQFKVPVYTVIHPTDIDMSSFSGPSLEVAKICTHL